MSPTGAAGADVLGTCFVAASEKPVASPDRQRFRGGAGGLFVVGLVAPGGRRLEWVTLSGYPQPVLDEFGAGIDLADYAVTTDVVRTGQPVLIRTAAE